MYNKPNQYKIDKTLFVLKVLTFHGLFLSGQLYGSKCEKVSKILYGMTNQFKIRK